MPIEHTERLGEQPRVSVVQGRRNRTQAHPALFIGFEAGCGSIIQLHGDDARAGPFR